LVVAIPAMIMFHYLSNQLRKLEAQMYKLNDKFLFIANQNFIR
jgi:biopolymer transport protein ExbB/TolQ